ncbi:hypothetical protein CRE_10560 [Caenorhabditis remanei]|uniref:Uncharacterized protein n=1 Tax=Caenorhabditis remanei TaxID=31234 RepID=E3N797_CAERE|nr:hypothetical protein CRE_10560 [Caenorhabditis remanei]
MILNLLTISALVGFATCGSYGSSNNYAAANPGYGTYFEPPRHYGRREHWRRRSSSESDEKWDCRRLGVFRYPEGNPNNVLFTAPKIAYFTQNGEEKAIAVCKDPQVQILLGESEGANAVVGGQPIPPGVPVRDIPIVSLSSNSGITLKCNDRKKRYEAINLVTGATVPLKSIACVRASKAAMDEYVEDIVDALQSIAPYL